MEKSTFFNGNSFAFGTRTQTYFIDTTNNIWFFIVWPSLAVSHSFLAWNWRILLGVSFYKKSFFFFLHILISLPSTHHLFLHSWRHAILSCYPAVLLPSVCSYKYIATQRVDQQFEDLSLSFSTFVHTESNEMSCKDLTLLQCSGILFGGETCLFARCFDLNFCAFPRSRSLHHFRFLDDSKLGVNLWEQ